MNRLKQLNLQFKDASTKTKSGKPKAKPLKPAIDNVWESMDMDQHLSSRAVKMRKSTAKLMRDI